MGSRIGRKIEAAREVRVEDVEAAGPQAELDRLDIDDHLVTDGHRARQAGVRDAVSPVHLKPHEPIETLDHGPDGATP